MKGATRNRPAPGLVLAKGVLKGNVLPSVGESSVAGYAAAQGFGRASCLASKPIGTKHAGDRAEEASALAGAT